MRGIRGSSGMTSGASVPGSLAESLRERAGEAYYEQYRHLKDNLGHDLARQCAESIGDSGLDGRLSVVDKRDMIAALAFAIRGIDYGPTTGMGGTLVDLACLLGIVPSFEAWCAEQEERP